MAKSKKGKGRQSLKPQGSGGKKSGILYSFLTILVSVLIVLAVFGGLFYYVLHNNIQGLGEQFRPYIQKIPVLKLALPPLPETEDPEDPKYLTQRELEQKYNDLRVIRDQLQGELASAQERVQLIEEEKQSIEEEKAQLALAKQDNEAQLEQIKNEQEQLKMDREDIAAILAEGDTGSFKEYFEYLDKSTAERIYADIVEQEAVDQEIKGLSKTYEAMEPKNAAEILEELGNNDMELLMTLIDGMKSDTAAKIMQNMTPVFAAELGQKIADMKINQQ